MGILDLDAALAAAQEQGLDLVEVAPTARPPVVRIMDYGKFKFEQAKMARQAKKKQHVIHLKEVKYRPGIEEHDFETKTRHARRFLGEGNKVKVTLMFRGRQIAHPELGRAVVDRVAADLADVALTNELAIPSIVVIAALAIWTSVRISLPLEDRASLGKLARRLRLVPAEAVG